MGDRFNTVAGWVLFAGIIALGSGIVGDKLFFQEAPEPPGYAIQGVESDAAAAPAGPSFDTLLASADVAKGKKIFAKCTSCHTVDQGAANGIGPNLWGIVGDQRAEGRNGYAFSSALKKVGGKWTFDDLNKWLTSPRNFAPGTKMSFAGLSSTQDRADVVAYLNSEGSNLPLPKPAAAPASADNATAAAASNATAAADNAAAPKDAKASAAAK